MPAGGDDYRRVAERATAQVLYFGGHASRLARTASDAASMRNSKAVRLQPATTTHGQPHAVGRPLRSG
jgi:hypothetical protein